MTLYKGAKLIIVKIDEGGRICFETWGQTQFEVIDYTVNSEGIHNVNLKVVK